MKRVQFSSPTLPYLFLLPQMTVVFIFFYWPSVQAIQSSFYLEDPFGFAATFVGLDNYEAIFGRSGFWWAIVRSLVWVLGNAVLIDIVENAKSAITEGESLAVTLKRSGEFPAAVTHMIAVGERSGALEDMLLRVADSFESEVDTKLDNLTGMLEPMMLVLLGGSVAFVVFSILMPMMEMQKLTQM